MSKKSAIVCGAGGFIGSHLVKRLKEEKYYVVGVDLKFPEFSPSAADVFLIGDLRDSSFCERLMERFPLDEIYQLAAEMGGAGYLLTGEHDADILRSSAQINLNVLDRMVKRGLKKVFFASSAGLDLISNQQAPLNSTTAEDSAYPAKSDSDYGFEKLFSERLYLAHGKNYDLEVRIGRFQNVFGPECVFCGGREKVVAALCRKISESKEGDEIEVWGDGDQTRSFLYIDEAIEGIRRLMESSFDRPMPIGSSEMTRISALIEMIRKISQKDAQKDFRVHYIDGPVGVRERTSDNDLIRSELNWVPSMPIIEGLKVTYVWINDQITMRPARSRRVDTSPLVGEMFYDFFR